MTTTAKVTHTAGPWKAIADMDGDHAIFAGKELVAVTDGWQHGNEANRDFKADSANANVIAAAPDMLEALEAIHALTFGNGLGFPQWITRIVEIRKLSSAAIAKAKGGAE